MSKIKFQLFFSLLLKHGIIKNTKRKRRLRQEYSKTTSRRDSDEENEILVDDKPIISVEDLFSKKRENLKDKRMNIF